MAKRVPSGSLYRPTYQARDGSKKTQAVWWMKYYVPGRQGPVRESTGCEDWEDAKLVLRRALGKYSGAVDLIPEKVTIADLLALVVDDYRAKRRASTQDLKLRVESHLVPRFGKLKPRELTSSHLRAYRADRAAAEAAPATVNRELAILRRALHLGHQNTPRLVDTIPHFEMLPEHNVREGILEHDKYRALRDACAPWPYLQLAFVVAYHTGLRRGELIELEWAKVDFARNRIELRATTTKNRRKRYAPIYGEMRAYLEMAKAYRDLHHPDCPWLIYEELKKQKSWLPLASFKKAWATATAAAGVPELRFHDLRRTAITNMEEAGIPRAVATSISGHRTESVYRRYVINRTRALDQAGKALEEHLAAKDGTLAQQVPGKVPGKVAGHRPS